MALCRDSQASMSSLMFVFRKQTAQVHAAAESAAHHLGLLSLLIERLEREHFTSPGLVRLDASLATDGAPASLRIKHLNRWLDCWIPPTIFCCAYWARSCFTSSK